MATPNMPDAAMEHLKKLIEDLRKKHETLLQPAPVPFCEIKRALAQENGEFSSILNTYIGYSRSVFAGASGAEELAGVFLIRELGRRPKRQNNLETMGMISVVYPELITIKEVPSEWGKKGFTLDDWRDFLKIALDHFVRGGGSLNAPSEWRQWIGGPSYKSWIVAPNAIERSKTQRYWSLANRSTQGRLVRLLGFLLEVDLQTNIGKDKVDTVLLQAWNQIRPILENTGSGYILSLDKLAFKTVSQAWICPITRRFLDTTVCGITPYLPKKTDNINVKCKKVNLPVYDLPFGGENNGPDRIIRAREWIESQQDILALREEGFWADINDRVIELAPYFSVAEHSAQQTSQRLADYEKKFKEGRINMLSCSTTMEMGIDIGGIQSVAMNNVPPHPANYLQRAGRAGRRAETRSIAITLCKANPHDQNVFLDTRWAFNAKLPLPAVSLNSSVIVQRHINSMLLSRFLTKMLSTEPINIIKLTCAWFFNLDDNGSVESVAQRFINWCVGYLPKSDDDLEQGLKKLVRHSLFEGQPIDRLIKQSSIEMKEVSNKWQIEWDALLDQEKSLHGANRDDPARRAIGFQKRRLAEEYLLRELATQGLLPSYGFPTSIASFDNITKQTARNLPSENGEIKGNREDNRFVKRDLASRDLMIALREFAPGAELVMDGLVYKSRGVTLNWHVPADANAANEVQAIRFAWRCRDCGASGITSSLSLAQNCEACGESIPKSDIQEYLEPSGFSVDFYEDPHNDLTKQQFIPVQRPWISARGEWIDFPNPALGRFRTTTNGSVYHHSSGLHGEGYALCLACGRAEPILPNGELPNVFQNDHNKLRSRADDRRCSGSGSPYLVKKRIRLGHQLQTDVLEIQLRNTHEQWITRREVALTIAVALRSALAELIGVQVSELGCDIQETRSTKGTVCQSLFIFDHNSAGYTSNAGNLIIEMFQTAYKRLDCIKNCDSSCPSCVLDFDQRFESEKLDRKAALEVLNENWLNLLKTPNDLCYFGDGSSIEIRSFESAVILESSKTSTTAVRVFLDGSTDKVDLAVSTLRTLSYRLIALSRPLEIVLKKSLLDTLGEEDLYVLSSLASYPTVKVGVLEALPTVDKNGLLIAEVCGSPSSFAWATEDPDTRIPNEFWGSSKKPLVFGTHISVQDYSIEWVEAAAIRPKISVESDREIEVNNHINGPLQLFGLRFWKLIKENHAGANEKLSQSNLKVVSISYSDRYLYSPLPIALLVNVVHALREILGEDRWSSPVVEVVTTNQNESRRGGYSYNKIYSDWSNMQDRDEVVRGIFDSSNLKVKENRAVGHGRVFTVKFSDGSMLSVRLDQGFGYWRVQENRTYRSSSSYYSFDEPISNQIKKVKEMNVDIKGASLPTEVFVKLR